MEYTDIGNVNPPDLMKMQNKMGFENPPDLMKIQDKMGFHLLVEDKETMQNIPQLKLYLSRTQ